MEEGRVQVISEFYSAILQSKRTIRVYLPEGYQNSEESYPVVYLHDGQWVFSEKGKERWNVDCIADELIRKKKIPPVILVGIDCDESQRRKEMTHITPPSFRRMGRRGFVPCYAFSGEGRGALYEAFIVNEVKPYIDQVFRTKPEKEHTALAGSSMGGLVTLCMGMNRHEVFGMLGLLSPAVHWIADKFYNSMQNYEQKIWLDCGMEESYYVDNIRELYKIFHSLGYQQKKNLLCFIQPGAVHTERYFAERFRMMLIWMFGDMGIPRTAEILGRDQISISGHTAYYNTVVACDGGVMYSDMEAEYRFEPEGIAAIEKGGEAKGLKTGSTRILYENQEAQAEKDISVVKAMSPGIILDISVQVPPDTSLEEPVVYHFFRDQYCVLQKKENGLYEGSIGIPRDWEFFGHMGRSEQNRDKRRECTAKGELVDRFIKASESQHVFYVVEAWNEQ